MSDLGQMLRTAREQRNLTIADVSRETRIKESFLEALENEEYAHIPGPAYVTGFLRNYARVVGLHPEDVVQEYYASRPIPQPTVKAATRVLANGHMRDYRRRLLWGFGGLVVAVVGAFTFKEYSDQYAHASAAPPLNVTPANTGTISTPTTRQATVHRQTGTASVRLHAAAPVLIHITVDGHRVFSGLLRAGAPRTWKGHREIDVVAYNGSLVRATFNGRSVGKLARHASRVVDSVTPGGWHHIS